MNNNPLRPVLGPPRTGEELLDMYFLDMRSALLETAASLDRIERAENQTDIFRNPHIQKLNKACEILRDGKRNRVEQILLVFSDPLE